MIPVGDPSRAETGLRESIETQTHANRILRRCISVNSSESHCEADLDFRQRYDGFSLLIAEAQFFPCTPLGRELWFHSHLHTILPTRFHLHPQDTLPHTLSALR